jgi:hypothetical protein
MDTVRQALALLAAEQVLTLVPVAGTRFRALVTEVAGGPVKGSWWGHPRGKLIYRIAEELEASPGVLVTRMIHGKVTFVHAALWPALLAVVEDASWRERAAAGLAVAEAALLARVEREGRVRLDGRAEAAAAKVLEARHLVVGGSEHTERGAHATVLRSWSAWAASARAVPAPGGLAAALATLAGAGLDLAAK